MLKLKDLQKYVDEAQSNHIGFEGKCHDCECDVIIEVDVGEDGATEIGGGAIYEPVVGSSGEKKIFLKCASCFEKDNVLRNYRPTEVFSRVVGYLRPVKQFNKGKQFEFKMRKNFAVGDKEGLA